MSCIWLLRSGMQIPWPRHAGKEQHLFIGVAWGPFGHLDIWPFFGHTQGSHEYLELKTEVWFANEPKGCPDCKLSSFLVEIYWPENHIWFVVCDLALACQARLRVATHRAHRTQREHGWVMLGVFCLSIGPLTCCMRVKCQADVWTEPLGVYLNEILATIQPQVLKWTS